MDLGLGKYLETSKTEVLQMPSATEVNLFQAFFNFIYKCEFFENFEFFEKFKFNENDFFNFSVFLKSDCQCLLFKPSKVE